MRWKKGHAVHGERQTSQKWWRRRHYERGNRPKNGDGDQHVARKATAARMRTWEWPCAVGQASEITPGCTRLAGGRSPVILGTIGSRIGPQKACFRRTRQLASAWESGPQIVRPVYNLYTNITTNNNPKPIYKHRSGFWGFGVIVRQGEPFLFVQRLICDKTGVRIVSV